jgi:inner membrane transporter RhtA
MVTTYRPRMETEDVASERTPAQEPSAASATPGQRAAGIAMMLASSASNQTGAALGALAFPAVGPVGVVAVRQLVTALVLVPAVRPRFRGLRRDQWLPVLGLTAVFSVMNLSLYAAVDRIGLGPAVTIEFLGPLTVAIVASRRVADKSGYMLEGVMRGCWFHRGKYHDLEIWSVLRDELRV